MGDTLIAVGGAFLAAGLLARLGRHIGLPTIPLFMAAGIIFGPNTPGLALVDDAHELELLAALGVILLLFHLGLEFSLDDLLGAFDYLVVDTSAANVHRDAAALGPLMDGTVLVVSANATRRETGRKTVEQLEQAGVSVAGAVLLDRTFPIPEPIYRRL